MMMIMLMMMKMLMMMMMSMMVMIVIMIGGDGDKDGDDDDEIKSMIFSIGRDWEGYVGGVCQVVVCVPMRIRVIYSE
jgi:ABC-type cobalt transport system substrate-binding protein